MHPMKTDKSNASKLDDPAYRAELMRRQEEALAEAEAAEKARGFLPGWAHEYLPTKEQDPKSWKRLDIREDGIQWITKKGMVVMASCCVERDGCVWMHISVSTNARKGKLPTWDDLKKVRNIIVGRDKFS